MNIKEAKEYGVSILKSSPTPQLDCEVLLSFLTRMNKTQLLFNRDTELSGEQEKLYKEFVLKRSTGLPVAYITGTKEFFGYSFFVTPDVLIPKPDTEILVEQAINVLEDKVNSKLSNHIVSICDMCTGSGCVGLSVLKYSVENKIVKNEALPFLVMADISEKALKVAEKNAAALAPSGSQNNTRLIRTNLFSEVNGTFDIIVTNPPYVPHKESVELLTDGRSEPLLALDGDVNLDGSSTGQNDGLGLIRNLIPQAVEHLNKNGFLLMETGEYNAREAEELFKKHGLTDTKITEDLEGQLRVVSGRLA